MVRLGPAMSGHFKAAVSNSELRTLEVGIKGVCFVFGRLVHGNNQPVGIHFNPMIGGKFGSGHGIVR